MNMSTTTLITKYADTQERTEYGSVEAGLVALALDAEGSFLTVNEPKSLQPLLYQKTKGAINIINIHEAPASLNLALFTNPQIREVIKTKTSRPYKALKHAFEEIEAVIDHYNYARYWLAH